MSKVVVSGLHAMIADFHELGQQPGFKTINKFEVQLAGAFAASQAIVHILSGGLKASGVPHSMFDGVVWQGGIDYDAHPGIFELALGDTPSIFHPEGQHGAFLTTAVEPFANQIGELMDECIAEVFGEQA